MIGVFLLCFDKFFVLLGNDFFGVLFNCFCLWLLVFVNGVGNCNIFNLVGEKLGNFFLFLLLLLWWWIFFFCWLVGIDFFFFFWVRVCWGIGFGKLFCKKLYGNRRFLWSVFDLFFCFFGVILYIGRLFFCFIIMCIFCF